MFPDRGLALADPKLVHTLERCAALPADHRVAIAADEGTVHRPPARRTVKLSRLRFAHSLIIASLLALAACNSGPARPEPIGVAYAGPMTLNLRDELAPRAAVTATVRHGERLEILERRYRFAKVRTASGAEGWTDGRQLLTPIQMSRLKHTADVARRLPAQGKATPFDRLNVHIGPNRQAPSFYQLKEGDQVDVIGHRVTARVAYNPDKDATPPEDESPVNGPRDAWSHVRLPDDRAGWVLTSMIMMSIPDEVAQYAEGHHISSYFSLGSMEDRGETKHHWLWTTVSSRVHPYQFDSFRVFVWNPRRHRYETAHIERNLRGYYPVEVHPLPGHSARFSLNFAGRDGVLSKRTYEFGGLRVRLIARAPWELPVEETEEAGEAGETGQAPSAPAPSLGDRIRQKWKEWFR